MIQLQGFEKVSQFPDEDSFWKWLDGIAEVAEVPGVEIDYFEREVIEKKYYVCMKDENGAQWMEQKFGNEGIYYYDENNEEIQIGAKQMGDIWKTITVRGVTPTIPTQVIEQHFQQFGEVKDINYVTNGKLNVRSNKVTLQLKIDEGKQLPVFIWNELKEGFYERWELFLHWKP